ncbi:protein DpdH [Mycolicibacterium elephantis]|uniref:protein DpdH n=1 Tax=Mycolicibacterium elephantis TaxID=81858 RepID=UPI003A8638C2
MSWHTERPTLCWEREAVLPVIPVEAESPTDGVFITTHSPLAIMERNQVDDPSGTIVSEQRLLAAVGEQPADAPIMPILGRSGTGKSHLVRWLRLELEKVQADHPNRRLIFVPKHKMSLRAILDLILDQSETTEVDEFRQRVHAATDQITNEKDARNRLRANLSILIAAEAMEPLVENSEEQSERRFLAEELPNLLDDGLFRQKLLADDGAIAQLTKEKLSGKGLEDKEEPFEFTAEDLKLSVDDTTRAGASARELAESLAADHSLRNLAATMLNEKLPEAVSTVFGVGGSDLKDLLIELRRELAKSGEELLLLIEDFSIFQGVQGGLIDAMTQVPTRDNPLCPMKVIMAVTTGYFHDHVPDTAKTRTYRAFDLDVPDSAASTDLEAFAVRYLNAVRVGPRSVDAAVARHEDVPNACDSCPVREECHTAFGHKNGIGLYPFNAFALQRAVQSRQKESGVFVPREVLKDVLRPVLVEDREALETSKFPSDEFQSRFASAAAAVDWNVELTARIRNQGETDELVERRRRMLIFYAPNPAPQNLDHGIHDAFSIPEVAGLPQASSVARPPTEPPEKPALKKRGIERERKSSRPEKETKPRLVAAVDQWSAGQALQQNDQNELRKLVHGAVVAYLNFEDGHRSDSSWGSTAPTGAQHFSHTTSIFIEGSKQTNMSGTRLDISRQDVDAVRTLRALAQFAANGSYDPDRGRAAELQRLTNRQVAKWAADIRRQLDLFRDDPEAVDPEVGYLATALILSAQMLGVPTSFMADNPSATIDAIFSASPEESDLQLLPNQLRTLRGFAISEKGKSSRTALQELILRRTAYTQGGGKDAKDAGVDTDRILRSHAEYLKNPDPAPPERLHKNVIDYVSRLQTLANKLDQVKSTIEQDLPDVSTIDADRLADTVSAVNHTLSGLQTMGMTPPRVDTLKIQNSGAILEPEDAQQVAALRQSLKNWESLSPVERLRALSGDWPKSALRLGPWLAALNTALDGIENHINSKIDPGLQAKARQLDRKLATTLDEAATTLANLLDSQEV